MLLYSLVSFVIASIFISLTYFLSWKESCGTIHCDRFIDLIHITGFLSVISIAISIVSFLFFILQKFWELTL